MRRRLASYTTIRHLRTHHEAHASLSKELDDNVTINTDVSKNIKFSSYHDLPRPKPTDPSMLTRVSAAAKSRDTSGTYTP